MGYIQEYSLMKQMQPICMEDCEIEDEEAKFQVLVRKVIIHPFVI